MDNITVSRRKHTSKKGNKENTQPVHERKLTINREFCKTTKSSAILQLKRNEKEGNLVKSGPLKATAKREDTRSATGEVLKKVKSVQKDRKGAAAAGDAKERQSLSQAFLTEQAVKQRKIAAEAPKPQAAVPSSKSAPGMYKGKVVQSKIGSIWKSSATLGGGDPKPPAAKPESQRVGNFTKHRSTSVADLHRRGTHKPALTRCKSVTDGPVSQPTVPTRPAFHSARPPARTVPATLTGTSSKNTTVAAIKGSRPQNSKVSVTDKKVNKPPPVTSTISQYRFTMESAEERRVKLANWLAAKGKTSKRPAMTTAASSKTSVSAKPKEDLKPQTQSQVEPQPAAQCEPEPEPEPSIEAQKPNSPEGPCADTQGAEIPTQSPTPMIMNTSLDLLDTSDADLPVDSIVVNLCDALEALETPSRCTDDISQVIGKCGNEEMDCKKEVECERVELKIEIAEDVGEQPKDEKVKDEAEESDEQKVETEKEVASDEDVMETTPEMEDASVVKYNVKTTPYLQSVRKTIEDKAQTTGCRRKSKIKDLKFLTPVRRSSRIQRQSCRLPSMLADHDPCVTSLAELLKLDEDPNAYIYRKNPALLEDLPDQTKL